MRFLAVLLLLAVPLPGAAQPETVASPQIKVGDRWVYKRTDRRMKPPTSIYEMRVSFVDARAIHTVLSRQGETAESDAVFTPEWSGVNSVDDGVMEVERGLLQFPLSPGREYRSAWDTRRPRMGNFQVRHERAVKVVGWEEIAVPAGKFRALKVQAEGTYRRMDRQASARARNTYWYVPGVKRWVKTVYQDPELEIVEELYFYRVQ